MSYLLSAPLTIAPIRDKPHTKGYITLRPSHLHTGPWLIFKSQNRVSRQSPKRPLPTPSGSTVNNRTESVVPSVEGFKSQRSDAFSFNSHITHDFSTQSQRAASAPPFRPDVDPVIEKEPAYIGDNTFKSIFKENLGSLGIVTSDLDSSEQQSDPVAAESIVQGCRLLSFLKDRHLVNAFVTQWFDVCEGSDDVALEGIVKVWLRKMWLCHGEVLEQQDPDKLHRLSELLWRNSQTQLVFDGNTTAEEWADLATGPNLRWEVIGIIAGIIGICATYCDSSHSIFKEHNVVRLTLAKQVHAISSACVSFSRKCNTLNDLFVWLLIEDAVCNSILKGGHKFEGYSQGGEYVSAIVALGWHQEIEANDKVPFFLAELRKRTRSTVYFSEIGSSSFLGRPPRASYHYWNLDPPHDLTHDQLMLDKTELEPILATMDANGFNTAGDLHRGTWIRVWSGFAPRREEILDLALRRYSREEIIQRAAEIERKTEEHWETLPDWLREARHQKINPAQPLMKQLYLTIFRQGTRANELLLQRVLQRKIQASSERMIKVAQAVFKEVLEVGNSQDMASRYGLEMSAIFVVHGLRAAALIATELLKQEKLPGYSKEASLPRSQTIQDLSVFAAKLSSVDPSDGGMFELSQQGRKTLTLILDMILAPKPAEQPSSGSQYPDPESHQQPQQAGYGQMEIDVIGNVGAPFTPGMGTTMPLEFNFGPPDELLAYENDSMFMQWLDSVDWERTGPWIGY
ncbi:putative Transcription factor domain-containing protein [Seiridium cardinale]